MNVDTTATAPTSGIGGCPAGYQSQEEEGVEGNDNGEEGDDSSEEENDASPPDERVRYEGSQPQGSFTLGMTFANAKLARDALAPYAVLYGYKLKLNPNEPNRIVAKCKNEHGCPFMIRVSKDGKNPGLSVKTLIDEHKCFRHFTLPSATAKYLARHFRKKIYNNPAFKVQDMQSEAEEILKIIVSFAKCKRAKRMIIQEMDGSYKVQFQQLEAYAAALKRSNPGSKAEIELCKESLNQGKRVFRRMFLCFDACKRGWIAGCRRLIGLDGSFLKGVCKGMLLSAIGIDADDQLVPIAWAVVDKENKANWRWFLCWLVQELQLGDGSEMTFISDMQKVKKIINICFSFISYFFSAITLL